MVVSVAKGNRPYVIRFLCISWGKKNNVLYFPPLFFFIIIEIFSGASNPYSVMNRTFLFFFKRNSKNRKFSNDN